MEGWHIKSLGSVCHFRGGGTPSKAVEDYWHGDIPWVSPKDMKSELVADSIDHISPEAVAASATSIVEAGAVLMVVRSGILARTVPIAVAGRALALNQDLKALCPRPSVDSWFLYYLLESKMPELLALVSRGATVHRLITDQVRAITFGLPPLPEQRRIVAILDEAFEAIAAAKANTEKNLQNARELLGRFLATVFEAPGSGWETRALGEAVRFIDYRGKTPPKREEGIRLITAKNVKMGFIQREPEEFIDPAVYDGWMTRGFPRPGDVLFTTEAPLGNVAQLDTEEKVVIGQRLITMQPQDAALDCTFLKYALMSPPIQASIHAKGTGATVLGIKASLLKTVQIWYPKVRAEQLRLVGLISAVEDEASVLASLASRKLAALDELKRSLLHQAFTGQLTAKTTDQQLEAVA